MSLMWQLGLRYFQAKKTHKIISFGAVVSILGLALGVMVLITVLSVMNGFDRDIHQKIFTVTRPLTFLGYEGAISEWETLKNRMVEDGWEGVPFVSGQGMLIGELGNCGALIQGVVEEDRSVLPIFKGLVAGTYQNLDQGFRVLLGEGLAKRLGVWVGDRVIIVIPQVSTTLVGLVPRLRNFEVSGIFRVGDGLGHDSSGVYMGLGIAQKLFHLGEKVTGLSIRLEDYYQALTVGKKVMDRYGTWGYVSTWAQEYGAFFHAIRIEKTMMFIILLFIIAVASFNLISSLVVSVYEKRSEIAILRTFGAKSSTIMGIFIIYGGLIGLIGILLGLAGGIVLSMKVSTVVYWLERFLHTKFITDGVYHLDYLPSQLLWGDLIKVSSCALAMSLLATIYPARRATKIDPVEVLRYE